MPSLDQRLSNPPFQAIAVFSAAFTIMCLGWLSKKIGWLEKDPLFAWSIASAFMLLFALGNSLLSLRADSFAKYWGSSMYSYMGLAFASGLAAWMFSGIPIGEAGSYRWIYVVVTFGFLVFLSMVNMMKKIVTFAEREEWNEPRKRR